MSPASIRVTFVSLLIVVGCTSGGTEPQLQHGAPVDEPLLEASGLADVIDLDYVSLRTGRDDGPQDGIFDSFADYNLGSVNNNGYTSFRTAFEFSLSGLTTGSTINAAELTLVLQAWEGTRSIEVHGYSGDGSVHLGDFALNGLVGTVSADASGTQTFVLDVTSFLAELTANGAAFAGFNVREEPPNSANFTVMALELNGTPVLSIDFLPGPASPNAKDDCKNDGWQRYGFKNQGQCVRYVNTGRDSRD